MIYYTLHYKLYEILTDSAKGNASLFTAVITDKHLGNYLFFLNICVSPVSWVFGVITIITKHKITAVRNNISVRFAVIIYIFFDIWLIKLITIDVYMPFLNLDYFIRKTNNTLNIILWLIIRIFKDYNVTALWFAELVSCLLYTSPSPRD